MSLLRRSFLKWVVAAALTVGFAPSAAAQTFTIHPGDTVVELGDSLTQFGWANVTGGLVDQVNVLTSKIASKYRRPAARLKVSSHNAKIQIPGGAITVINRGVAGWTSTQIEADKVNIPALNPKAIILDIGINDADLGVSPSTYRSNVDSALAYYIANIPGVQILFVSPLVNGDAETTGCSVQRQPRRLCGRCHHRAGVGECCGSFGAVRASPPCGPGLHHRPRACSAWSELRDHRRLVHGASDRTERTALDVQSGHAVCDRRAIVRGASASPPP